MSSCSATSSGLCAACGNAWGVLSTSAGPCSDSISFKGVVCNAVTSIPPQPLRLTSAPSVLRMCCLQSGPSTPPGYTGSIWPHPKPARPESAFQQDPQGSCALWSWRLVLLFCIHLLLLIMLKKRAESKGIKDLMCCGNPGVYCLIPFIANLLFFRRGYQHISGP